MGLARSIDFPPVPTTLAATEALSPHDDGLRYVTVVRFEDRAGTATAIRAAYGGSSLTVGVPAMRVSDLFLEELRSVATEFNVDACLDFIFRKIDGWLRQDQFDLCDEILSRVDPGTLGEDLLVGLLTITLAAKNRLPSRVRLLSRVESTLQDRMGDQETRKALVGLT